MQDEITAEPRLLKKILVQILWILFELVTNLEEEYNIEIPAEAAGRDLTTVGKVIDYLKSVNIEA